MGIRFDASYSKEIRDIVRNFNKRRNRLIKEGYKNVPRPALVSELKDRYDRRSDLNRELQRLKGLRRRDILRKIETDGGVKANEWEYNYIKSNINEAKDYFVKEYERVSKRISKYPGERTYLDTLSAKINLLQMEVDYMSQSQFKSAKATVDEFARSPSVRRTQYRNFLSEVEWVMERIGYSKQERTKFFKKFEQLTPSQFIYAFNNNAIIDKIYRLYHKNEGEEPYLTDSDENAEEIIDILVEQADTIVEDAKLNSD